MSIQETQNIIADPSFVYGGNSLEVLEIVNAIKEGYRLCKVEEAKNEIAKHEEVFKFMNRVHDKHVVELDRVYMTLDKMCK